MQKQSPLLRGSETHVSASTQISLPVSEETGSVKGKGDVAPESLEARRDVLFKWAYTARW